MITGLFLLKPLGIISKGSDYFLFDENEVLSDFKETEFYININEEQKIKIEFKGNGAKYVGVAYLPGNADVNDCFLSWDNPDQIKLIKRLKGYQSGEYNLAGAGYSAIFFIRSNNKKYDFMLTTLQGSSDVKPLFINVDENKGSIEDMNSDWNHNTSCEGMANYDGNSYYVSIKGRGNMTWHYGEKKPYNITFYDNNVLEKKIKVCMAGEEESSKWSMLANYADPTLLRNRIGYMLADEMGIGLVSEYYDVWMNGKYLGNYLITPKNDYKASKSGFILELDNYIDYEDSQFNLSNKNGIIDSLLFTVKDDSGEMGTDNIKSWMQKVWNAIEDYESDDYLNYIDIESWANYYLACEFFKNFDIVNGSILMHKDGNNKEDKLKAGPIWDLDNALGTVNWNDKNGMDFNHALSADYKYIESVELEGNNYCLLQELYKHNSFKNEVNKAYTKYQNNINEIINQIDRECDKLYYSIQMNNEMWPLNEKIYNNYQLKEYLEFSKVDHYIKYNSTVDYYDYLDNLKSFVKARTDFLKDNY